MDLETHPIPGTLDMPPLFLLWSIDEVAPFILGISLGMFINQFLICAGLGVVVSVFYRKHRDTQPDGFALHLLYAWGLPVLNRRAFPNPYERIWRV